MKGHSKWPACPVPSGQRQQAAHLLHSLWHSLSVLMWKAWHCSRELRPQKLSQQLRSSLDQHQRWQPRGRGQSCG